jgi:hypothetical protein
MRRGVRYVMKFEVKYCVLKLKEKFIIFASEKKSHREQLSDREIPVVPYSESRTTKNIYSIHSFIHFLVQFTIPCNIILK